MVLNNREVLQEWEAHEVVVLWVPAVMAQADSTRLIDPPAKDRLDPRGSYGVPTLAAVLQDNR